MKSTREEEIFPGIYRGDIIVSLAKKSKHREVDDILEVLPKSKRNFLYYRTRSDRQDHVNSSDSGSFRKATAEETQWYKSTYKEGMFLNLKDMPKVNNHYQIY